MTDPFSMAVAGLGSIKTALDITKTLSDAHDTSNLLAVKLELQGLLLQAQETQATLIGQKRQLEERVRELEAWEREKEQYELTALAHGVFAYCVNANALAKERSHKLCANCFARGKKSFLQSDGLPGEYGGTEHLKCFECSAVIGIPHEGRPFPSSYSDSGGWQGV